jgi:hypothetical protein
VDKKLVYLHIQYVFCTGSETAIHVTCFSLLIKGRKMDKYEVISNYGYYIESLIGKMA